MLVIATAVIRMQHALAAAHVHRLALRALARYNFNWRESVPRPVCMAQHIYSHHASAAEKPFFFFVLYNTISNK